MSSLAPLLTVVLFLAGLALAGWFAVALRSRSGSFRGFGRKRRLALVERLDLGERRFVALVRLDDRELLVGGAPQALSVLHSAEARVEPAAESAAAPALPFQAVLARLLRPRTPAGEERS